MPLRTLGRLLRGLAATLLALLLLLLASFAIPVPVWRTGELPAPALPIEPGGPRVELSPRVWIDTDAACGHGRRTDPDDCLALLLLATAREVEIAGISTVFGNAPLEATDRVTRALAAQLGALRVHRGADRSLIEQPSPMQARTALREALAHGPLTILALGPLTNLALALQGRPDLQRNVTRLVLVMGRRPGHLFHPAEGKGQGILFGHGPVFRDFNVDLDREAARAVLGLHLPTTLVPYDAARGLLLDGRDLAAVAARGGAWRWAAGRAQGWLGFWRDEVGLPGFYPFDLVAAAYVMAPRYLDCAHATAWVGKDPALWRFIHDPDALLVGPPGNVGAETARVVYCTGLASDLHRWLMARLAAAA